MKNNPKNGRDELNVSKEVVDSCLEGYVELIDGRANFLVNKSPSGSCPNQKQHKN